MEMEITRCSSRRRNVGGMEENILALLDATGSKDTQDANDDRIAFLLAVRSACISPVNGVPPTKKMTEAVFQILTVGKSLELLMESFWLLNELDRRFPRVYVLDQGESGSSSELVVDEEAWVPFAFNLDVAVTGKDVVFCAPLDPLGFQLLIEDLAELVNKASFQTCETKSIGTMLLFQYLVNILEADFQSRNQVYNETMNWILLRESLLSMLLTSRKVNYKALVKDCLSIICGLPQISAAIINDLESPHISMVEPSKSSHIAVAMALPEVGSSICTAMQKFLKLIMELDISRKKADMQGCITRADGVRTALVEIIVDELTYDKDMLSPFLQIFSEPKWKLEIILQYLSKYIAKPSFRTRRSNGSVQDISSFREGLKYFSDITNMRNITKRISVELVQVLLAHGFEAHFSLFSSEHAQAMKDSSNSAEENSFLEICEDIISAFSNLKSLDKDMEILPFGKEALFSAATVLSSKSGAQLTDLKCYQGD